MARAIRRMTCDSALLKYWGKADPAYAGEPKWHPLVYHCLDVAAVGVEYLTRTPAVRRLFAQRLGGEQGLIGWITFWLALHDLGKFAESFQGQRPDLLMALRGRNSAKSYTLRHDSVGWLLWAGPVRKLAYQEYWFGADTAEYGDGLNYWAQAVTGHHGQPPEQGGFWETHCDRREDRDTVVSFIGEVRALLAPAGVGTLDQVLLAALQSKHQSLRLLGLVHKVLVVDEVHACDAYMLRVLAIVLAFHARAGGSAILLSATLPQAMKRTLLDAFARGCGEARAPTLAQTAYPLATSWSVTVPESLTETPLATRASLCRQVAVRYIEAEDEIVAGIEAALATGQCVCWRVPRTRGDEPNLNIRFSSG